MKQQSYLITALASSLLFSCLHAGSASESFNDRLSQIETELAQENKVQPVITSSPVFFAEGSYLLWRMQAEGFELSNLGASAVGGQYTDLEFEWNSGFRVGMGYRCARALWEISTRWTHLHSRAQNTMSNLLSPSGFASGFLHVHLNVFDGEVARFFQVTPHLAFKAHAGVRGLLISQKSEIINNGASDRIYFLNSRERAVGVRAGVHGAWEFAQDFSLYSDVGGSLLSSTFNLAERFSSSEVSINTIQEIRATVVGTLDLSFGLAYEHSFDGKAALSVLAGWEMNDFFNQSILSNTDLTYQGLTAKIRLDF